MGAQVVERDLTGGQAPAHRPWQRERLQEREGRRDPVRTEAVDRRVHRGVDSDEQRGLDEQLGDVARALVGGVAASSASSKSTRWGWLPASTIDVLQREVAVRDAGAVERGDLEPQPVEERAVDARGIDLRQALTRRRDR